MTKYYLWLILVFRYSRDSLTELLEKYKTPEGLYNAFREGKVAVRREYIENAEKTTLSDAESLIDAFNKRGISIITSDDELYPESLFSVPNPPLVLFAKGNTSLLKSKLITVSGALKITDYTIRTETKVCSELCKDYTLVSSLIEGCEQLACLTAVKCGKGCIEVLPCGIEYEYPKNSRLMREQILMNDGCIISEYLPDTKTASANFFKRARISGGISKASIIFQAGIGSKSFNVASYNPSVFFIPPNDVFDPSYAGTVKYIRKGAQLYLGTEDIARVFEEDYIAKSVEIEVERKKAEKTEETDKKPETGKTEYKTEKAPVESNVLSEELFETSVHFSVYRIISEAGKPITFDEILRNTDMDISELSEILLDLEISGNIAASAGNRYSAL